MNAAVDATFYGAVGLYAVAALVAASYFWRAEERLLTLANRIGLVGAALLLVTFALRAIEFRRLPFTTMTDSLNLFMLLSTAVMMLVVWGEKMRPLLSFYLPPVALIGLINAAAAHNYLHDAPTEELQGPFLAIHVGLAFLAYALFFVASVTSLGYCFQANRLKRHQTTGLFQRLPSLERLDRVLFRLIGVGYPLFGITLILGLIWAYVAHELLNPYWWLAPKIVMALIMALFCSVIFHSRRLGRLRGPKLAYVVFIGVWLLLAVYVVLSLAQLNNYNFFWNVRS